MSFSVAEKDLQFFAKELKEQFNRTISYISPDIYLKSVEMIIEAEKNKNRVHITGIGKPAHISGYIASLMSSTGTPTYILDGTEAIHGSSGQVLPGDIVIAISNSGNTKELIDTIITLKNNGAKIIGVSGNKTSELARMSNAFLHAEIKHEGDPLNRAPRISIDSELIILQGLTIILQSLKDISPQQYVKWHPAGALGKLKKDEENARDVSRR